MPGEPQDPRNRPPSAGLELSGVEPLVAASLAREHYIRITVQGRRFDALIPTAVLTTSVRLTRTLSSIWRSGSREHPGEVSDRARLRRIVSPAPQVMPDLS